MKISFSLLLVLSVNLIFAQATPEFIANHLILKVSSIHYNRSGVDLAHKKLGISQLDSLSVSLGVASIEPIGKHDITRTFLLIFDSDIDVSEVLKKYQASAMLEFAEPDFISYGGGAQSSQTDIIPNDNFYFRQWGLKNEGSLTGVGPVVAGADVNMEAAWEIQTGDPDLIIAIPDSGLRMSHPEIASRLWVNPNEIAGNGIDDDFDGYTDDVNGWDFVNNDNLPTDDHGHGTNVIGILGAIANNNSLYAGVNWNSKIMPLKVLNTANNATGSNLVASLYYAVDHGAKIISFSIGGTGLSSMMADCALYAQQHDVLIVACMMNADNAVLYYPAALSTSFDNIIAVGSTNPDDQRTSPFFWSTNSGSSIGNHINVVAPGNYIYGLDYISNTNPNSYWGGTSQATPLVAGVASLMLSQNPTLTPAEIRNILQDTADDQVGNPNEDTPGFDIYMGHGRVNALAALQNSLNIAENINEQEFQIINPERDGFLQLYCKGNYAGIYNVHIYTIEGKLLLDEELNLLSGTNNIPFGYPSGNYILSLKNVEYGKIFKVVKN